MESNEVRMARLEEKVDNIGSSVNELKDDLRDHVEWEGAKYQDLNNRFDKLDKRFANKWVEKIVIAIGIAIAGGFISMMMALISK